MSCHDSRTFPARTTRRRPARKMQCLVGSTSRPSTTIILSQSNPTACLTRPTVSSVPDVVGVSRGAELTVGRVVLFVAALVVAGCERPSTTESTAAVSARAASARPVPDCGARCRMGGLCQWDAERDRCVARSNEECAASDSCKTSGLCVQDKTVCIGTKRAHCTESERCKREGVCTFVGKGLFPCQARGNDCAAADLCRRKGRCTAVGGKCAVANNDDCVASEACREHGQCSAKPAWQGDVAVYSCAALTNEDCKRGNDCRERELCTAANGACR